MCQEYHCDCCSDEQPEDACECIKCEHGDEDLNGKIFLQDVDMATRSLSLVKYPSVVNKSGASTGQWCSGDGKDLYGGGKKGSLSCCASSVQQSSKDPCRNSSCRGPVQPHLLRHSREQSTRPLQYDSCCKATYQDAKSVDSLSSRGFCSGRTTGECCGEETRNDCCTPCDTTCSCSDDDSGGPPSSESASLVSSFCEAARSCQSSGSHIKASDVTCESRNLSGTATRSPRNGGTSQSRALFSIVTPLSPGVEDKCCKSESCNGGTCESGNFSVIVTRSSSEDKCCESKSCNGGESTCETQADNGCKEKLQADDGRYRSVSRMADCSGCYPNLPTTSPSPCAKSSDNTEKKLLVRQNTTKLRVQNICCAMETKLVQESLEPLGGVVSVAVNVIGRLVYVRHDPEVTSPTELVNTLNRVHLGASVMETGSRHPDDKTEGLPPSLSSFLVYLLIQTILMMVAVVAYFADASWFKWLAIAEIVFGIFPVFKKAFVSFKACTLDINILMLIAIAGTLGIQDWLESAAVVYVFSLAEALQEYCLHKVQQTISGLMLKAPQVATLASSGECVPIEAVAIGTAIAIRPGELIPLDGVVVSGRSAVDESSVSGESVPVEKSAGSKVFSGTVNQNGFLEVKTTADSTSSTVTKVAQLVQEAQTSSATIEIAINRFAKYYTPAVIIVAALVVVIPAILGAAGVGTYSQEIKEWGKRALVLLVIACPCALVMSTPIAVVCSITAAARKGALIKGGAHLETLARLQVLAFDKTGTLTEGKFQVVDIDCSFGVRERTTLRLAAALENKSSHPLAAAIVNEFAGCIAEMVKSQRASLPEVLRFELHEGQGISGIVDGHLVQIGNYEFLHQIAGKTLNKLTEDKYIRWSNESKTVIFVCVDSKLAMMIALSDTIRPNCLATLDWLRNLRVQSAMITGDNSRTAMAVRNKLGLDECVAEMKPENKMRWVTDRQAGIKTSCYGTFAGDQQLRRCSPLACCSSCSQRVTRSRDNQKYIVGMVGDGVNDGPALAAANIGIAMGAGGTALAVEAADVALMSNNLAKIPELVELGRFCRRIVAENIAFSVVLKVVIVVATLVGKTSLWMAVLADVLGLLFVLLNGLRPLWWKAAGKGNNRNMDNELAFQKNARPVYSYESYV